jgi:hypothetical protein
MYMKGEEQKPRNTGVEARYSNGKTNYTSPMEIVKALLTKTLKGSSRGPNRFAFVTKEMESFHDSIGMAFQTDSMEPNLHYVSRCAGTKSLEPLRLFRRVGCRVYLVLLIPSDNLLFCFACLWDRS